MGKAARWLKALLSGRRPASTGSTLATENQSPDKVKKRWGFVKSIREVDPKSRLPTPPVAAVSNVKREERSAVKIQAAFRGYLARRALRALKGLVKLQALVRGSIVRKQAAETLRCMQALVRAQARARSRACRANKSTSAHSQPGPKTPEKSEGSKHGNSWKQEEMMKWLEERYLDSRIAEKEGRDSESLFSGEYMEHCPSYMANTESSRAKARSQSVPKQRPQRTCSSSSTSSTSSLQAKFANRAYYQGSGRLDRLGMPIRI
ncbi:hypothetical protein J5N97_029915 [Dioscorea zingiberensis]|uniref:DUF4005 domain-containing protein n=1 Tax=Dioscorea zingiberensis TaxID=325984 RepID=A0A9D5H3M2_9LILI|nr:hypothetical protein J5N97_029915 [Dioscorea zingiberensis]